MSSVRDVVGIYFERFASSTVIRVFNFIRTSRFLVERIFWFGVLLFFSCMTVMNVTHTVQTYFGEPTASHVSVAFTRATGFNFSHANLCLEMRPDKLLQLYTKKIDKILPHFQNSGDFVMSLKNKLHAIQKHEEEVVKNLIPSTINMSQTDAATVRNKYHDLDTSTIKLFTEDDIAIIGVTLAMLVRFVDIEQYPIALQSKLQPPTVEKIYEAFVEKKTNFSELLGLVAESLCLLLQIRYIVRHVDASTNIYHYEPANLCTHASTPIFFGVEESARMEMVCYRKLQLVLRSSADYVALTMHPETLYKDQTSGLRFIPIDISGKRAWAQQRVLLARFNMKQLVDVSHDTVAVAVNLRRRGCFDTKKRKGAQLDCELWCRVESILSGCRCMPLLRASLPEYANLPEGIRDCVGGALGNLTYFSNQRCRQTLLSEQAATNCSQECYSYNCETLLFSSTIIPDGDPTLVNFNATTAIKLTTSNFVHLGVNEYVTMDLPTLVASLGGNLSLYLGASFLAFVHIIVFFIKLPFEVAFSDKTVVQNEDSLGVSRTMEKLPNGAHYDFIVAQFLEMKRELSMLKREADRRDALERRFDAFESRLNFIDLDRRLLRGALRLNGGHMS